MPPPPPTDVVQDQNYGPAAEWGAFLNVSPVDGAGQVVIEAGMNFPDGGQFLSQSIADIASRSGSYSINSTGSLDGMIRDQGQDIVMDPTAHTSGTVNFGSNTIDLTLSGQGSSATNSYSVDFSGSGYINEANGRYSLPADHVTATINRDQTAITLPNGRLGGAVSGATGAEVLKGGFSGSSAAEGVATWGTFESGLTPQ